MPNGTTTRPVLNLQHSPPTTGPVPHGDSGDRGPLREVPAPPQGSRPSSERPGSFARNTLRKIRGGSPRPEGAITASWLNGDGNFLRDEPSRSTVAEMASYSILCADRLSIVRDAKPEEDVEPFRDQRIIGGWGRWEAPQP